MARLLACEWDASEARVVVGSTRGRELLVEQAFTVDLTGGEGEASEATVAQRLEAALAGRQIARGETLVALGRTNIELRVLSLPPAPPEELPDLVRFQASRQFSTIADDWPLDFVPLATGETGKLSVLAATISPQMVAQIQQTCTLAGLTPKRLVLRPFAAASLVRRFGGAGQGDCRMLVDLLGGDVDLTVLCDGEVAFVRTVRVPVDEAGQLRAPLLIGEIRRTIGAALNQLGGRPVERITLCCDRDQFNDLKRAIEEQLSLETTFFDPFAGMRLGVDLSRDLPRDPERFAPLLGLLEDEANGAPHGIDFLHPRRRPVPPSRGRQYAKVGALAAAIVALLVGWIAYSLWALSSEIAVLTKKKANQKKEVEAAKAKKKDVDEVKAFLSSDVTWINELTALAEKLPDSDQLILTELGIRGGDKKGGGTITIKGNVREGSTFEKLEESLSDERHRTTTNRSEETNNSRYPWKLDATMDVQPEKRQLIGSRRGAPEQDSPQSDTKSGTSPEHGGQPKDQP